MKPLHRVWAGGGRRNADRSQQSRLANIKKSLKSLFFVLFDLLASEKHCKTQNWKLSAYAIGGEMSRK
jgi:hypothetical protein